MPISETLLPEFDNEMANTRKTLERVPDDKFTWKPHAKSYTFGALAHHVANIVQWALVTFREDSFNLNPPGGKPWRPEPANSRADILAQFDRNVAEARAALLATTDGQFAQPWSLISGEHTIFTMPRAAVYRAMIMNHLIHHRAQLTVYLRLNDLPVPALYGPSADEQ